MPWSPRWRLPSDPRVDPYRDRVAALSRRGSLAGHVLILTEHYATQTGGHLWWRRWGPDREVAVPHLEMLDGSYDDSPIGDDDLETELAQWSRDEMPVLGERLQMRWLEVDEALAVVPVVFVMSGCFDNDGEIMWSLDGTRPPRRQPGR